MDGVQTSLTAMSAASFWNSTSTAWSIKMGNQRHGLESIKVNFASLAMCKHLGRLMKEQFQVAVAVSQLKSGVPCRSGSVSETIGATYTAETCRLTRAISPISFSIMQLRPNFRVRRADRGNRKWTGAPPLFGARIGRGAAAQLTFAQHPLGGSLPSHVPGGKSRTDTRGGQDGTHERP